MAAKKKTTKKKFSLKRSDIVERIEQIVDSLSEIDTTETSPNDVAMTLASLQNDLEELSADVTQEEGDFTW